MKEKNNIIFTVGIDKYQSDSWKDLNNAVFDCKALISLLKSKYSFEENPNSLFDSQATKENIYRELTILRNIVNEDDNLIFFFAGHGNINPHTKRGYLIPHEGTLDPTTWMENSVIKDFIQDLKCMHVWLILDSCFSGSFLTNTRGYVGQQLYCELNDKISRWVLTSGREEKVLDGSKGEHSPFAKALLSFLDNNENKYSCISEIAQYVKILTANTSKQVPQSNYIDNIGHEGGELILTLKNEFCKTEKKSTIGISSSIKIKEELAKYNSTESKIASGKELLLVYSGIEDCDFIIFENFRFDEEGNKKLTFKDGCVFFEEDFSFKLVQRFATNKGLERYLESNREKIKTEKQIPFICAHKDINSIENSLYSIAHSNYLQSLLDANPDKMRCLHCNEKISTDDGYLIEIDEIDLIENIGTVHVECLRPCDRIIGSSGYKGLTESYLINFDYELWLELLKKGQGQISPIYKNSQLPKTIILSWNERYGINEGKYCIREHYDNGEIRYVKRGKDIERFSENKIDQILKSFNNSIKEKEGEIYNPAAMIIETKQCGALKYIKQIKTEDQSIAIASKYEKVLYSKQLTDEVYNLIEHDYAPLVILKDIDSKQIFCIGDIIPLISKVQSIDTFIANWRNIVGDINKCSLEILKSDKEVNEFLMRVFRDDLRPILNPMFNDDFSLDSGIEIIERDTILSSANSEVDNVREEWKAGDIVKLVFPEMKSHDRFPIGKLLTNIFNDNGEKCIIFQPIENGKILESMQYKIPIHLIQKI